MALAARDLKQKIAAHLKSLLGGDEVEIVCLGGHASYRIYHRVTRLERSLIVMELAGDPLASEEASSGERPAELPFITIQRYLRAGGVAVPELYATLEADGLLLLEDLGEETLEDAISPLSPAKRECYYQRALDDLIALQRYTAGDTRRDCLCFTRAFDQQLLRWELDHFVEWLLGAERGAALDQIEAAVVDEAFERIAAELAALPQIVAHRDFQSRNLMVQRSADDYRLRMIDFQDALLAPLPYDLVALLRDSYVDLGLPQVHRLLRRYIERAAPPMDDDALIDAFWLQALQRKLKDAGRFVYIDRLKGNRSFLGFIPLTLRYIAEAFDRLPRYASLRSVLAGYLPELSRSGEK